MRNRLIGLLCAAAVCLGLFALSPAAAAEDKSYTVDRAVFTIRLNADGSADVSENWTLSFQSGTFTRFYKDIYTDLPPVEEFSDLTDLGVWIDGVACAFTGDTAGRPDYHYNRTDSSRAITLSAYLHTGPATHTYSFRYTLGDVVKQVDGDYYLFCFRPVGANFSERVQSLIVAVETPEGCVLTDLYHTGGEVSVSGSVAVYASGSRKGMYRLRLRMDGGQFGAVPQITAAQSRQTRSAAQTRRLIRIWTAVFSAGLLAAFLAGRRKNAVRKQAAMGSAALLEPWRRGWVSPLELCAVMDAGNYVRSAHGLMFVCLADAVSQGLVVEEDGYFLYRYAESVYEDTCFSFLFRLLQHGEEDPAEAGEDG